MKKATLAILLVLLFTACGYNTNKDYLETFQYGHIDNVVDCIGLPDAEQTIMGKKVYIWSTNFNQSFPITTYGQTTTNIGINAYTSNTSVISQNLSCKLKIIVNSKDIITDYEWDGNIGGCRKYDEPLYKCVKAKEKEAKEKTKNYSLKDDIKQDTDSITFFKGYQK